jgi:uncharacterized damage-inducible protein DinB
LPDAWSDLVGGASGDERRPDLAWSVTAYVCHVADNLHIWAERLQGAVRGTRRHVAPYDENVLAAARAYERIDLQGALWSLARSAEGWSATLRDACRVEKESGPMSLVHPERGELQLPEIARANCHDALHHQWDVGRILGTGHAC